jgi:tripartite-type tricarboxylate transporter receptor subunit TctC
VVARLKLATSRHGQCPVWHCLAVQAARRRRQKISASLDRALNDELFRASLEKIGFPVFRPRSAAAIQEFIDADRARWSAVIRAQNISLD